MPSNKQAQPLKPLLKTWTGWERGIGYLPESDEDETKGLYYANGVIGMHGELRPAPVLRQTTLKSHILRRIYHAAGNREAAAIALQIPNAVQGTQPTIKRIGSKNGTASSANAAEFFVGSFNKSTNNSAQTVNHSAGFTTKGAMFWSSGQTTDGTPAAGAPNFIGLTDTDAAHDRCVSWNSKDAAGGAPTAITQNTLTSGNTEGDDSTLAATVMGNNDNDGDHTLHTLHFNS